jgi:phenylalanine-4-hydroxylase
MLQEPTTALPPPHLRPGAADWRAAFVAQEWERFGEEDHAVWDLLFARQVACLDGRAVARFLDGLDLLKLARPGIPRLGALNLVLEPRTGWRTVAVPGLVDDAVFFALLARRLFPIGNFIRARAQLDYLEAPDCFHDLFGHVPMLACPSFARSLERIGRLGTAALAAGAGARVARLYWHSVEFGLALEQGALRILGAGLASSFGEARHALESETVQRLPFSAGRAAATPYRPDAFQPRYFVLEDLEGFADLLSAEERRFGL